MNRLKAISNIHSMKGQRLPLLGLLLLILVAISCGGKNQADSDKLNHQAMQQHNRQESPEHAGHDHEAMDGQGDSDAVWTCSMHPQVRKDEPGTCPLCGMELIRAAKAASKKMKSMQSTQTLNSVRMTEEAVKLARIATTPVVKERATESLRLPGEVVVNEHLTSVITAHFPGRIIDLFVDYEGQYVAKGQKLATIYSPELLTAQKEFMEAVRFRQSNPALYRAARRKLEYWELAEQQIDQLESSGEVMQEVAIISPVSGYLMRKNIERQQHVMEGTIMYRVAELHSVWVELEADEQLTGRVRQGQEVAITLPALSGREVTTNLTFVGREVDLSTRTLVLRAELPNEKQDLKPGMIAEGTIKRLLLNGEPQLLIPETAVLWTGTRSLVYVKQPDGPVFGARKVTLGPKVGHRYVVLDGLAAGEEVVTHGAFKIDSAAQIEGSVSMMNPAEDSAMSRSVGGSHHH